MNKGGNDCNPIMLLILKKAPLILLSGALVDFLRVYLTLRRISSSLLSSTYSGSFAEQEAVAQTLSERGATYGDFS